MSLEDLDPKAEQLRTKGRDQGQLDLPLAPHRASSGRRPSRGSEGGMEGQEGTFQAAREMYEFSDYQLRNYRRSIVAPPTR